MFIEYFPSIWLCGINEVETGMLKKRMPGHIRNMYYSWVPEVFHVQNTELNRNSASNKV